MASLADGTGFNGTIQWEALCSYGLQISSSLDKNRWILGDLACIVGTKYGEDFIGHYAKEIGQHKKTLEGYRRVARFYPDRLRVELFEDCPNLFYSHYKNAMRAGNTDDARRYLVECSANNWTVDEASRYLSDRLGVFRDDSDGDDNPGTGGETNVLVEKMPLESFQIRTGLDGRRYLVLPPIELQNVDAIAYADGVVYASFWCESVAELQS